MISDAEHRGDIAIIIATISVIATIATIAIIATIATIAIIAIIAHSRFARNRHRKPALKSSVCTEWGCGLGAGGWGCGWVWGCG